MKRVKVAAGILTAIIVFTVVGVWQVQSVTSTLSAALNSVEENAHASEYDTAQTQMRALAQYYKQKEPLLAVFMGRNQTSAIMLSLASIEPYLDAEHTNDLKAELSRARTQIYLTKHLFFNVL